MCPNSGGRAVCLSRLFQKGSCTGESEVISESYFNFNIYYHLKNRIQLLKISPRNKCYVKLIHFVLIRKLHVILIISRHVDLIKGMFTATALDVSP